MNDRLRAPAPPSARPSVRSSLRWRLDLRAGAWVFAAVALGAGLAAAPIGCGDDDTPATPTDSGAPGDAGADVAADVAADAASESEVGSSLSPRAQKGLASSPFTVDLTGLSAAQQEQVGTGSYLVNAVGGCNDCHGHTQAAGPPKFLGGGTPFDLGGGMIVYARNLTSDPTTGLALSEAQFVEALQTGKDFRNSTATTSQSLIVMPWFAYRWMSVTDLKAIYAYLKRVPADANAVPADAKGALASVPPTPLPASFVDGEASRSLPAEDAATDPLWAQRGLSLQPVADPPALAGLSTADKALYGRGAYLVNAVASCNDCHTNPDRDRTTLKITTTAWMTGGRVFAVPPGLDVQTGYVRSMAADLLGQTNGAISSDYADFHLAFVDGKEAIDDAGTTRTVAWPMPWTSFRSMVEEDVKAIHTYLASQARLSGAADKVTQPPARYCAASADCKGSGETCEVGTHECIGGACASDADCGACQTCTGGKCKAPAASSSCLTSGI